MIVTFYSYKGGTGRTMALANIAVLLAMAGKRVLAVDFDLEAPGLWRFFQGFHADINRRAGLLDMLLEHSKHYAQDSIDWRDYIVHMKIEGHSIDLMTSGKTDGEYPARVLAFDWHLFFDKNNGGSFIERLRADWQNEYDFVLIDSRTGITDTGGVCTIALPDLIIPVFVANYQNIEGILDVLQRAQRGRQALAYDRAPALVLPILSRFDSRTEYESAEEWLDLLAKKLRPFYADWLPKSIAPRQILERTKLPYVAYFSFGERLAVLRQGLSDPESLGYALNSIAQLIQTHLANVAIIALGVASATGQETTGAIGAAVEPLEIVQTSASADVIGSVERAKNPSTRIKNGKYCPLCPGWWRLEDIIAVGDDGSETAWDKVILRVGSERPSIRRPFSKWRSPNSPSLTKQQRADIAAKNYTLSCPYGHRLTNSLASTSVIGLIGNVYSGKSHFLAGLAYEIVYQNRLEALGIDVFSEDASGIAMDDRIRTVYGEGRVLPATERGLIGGPYTYRAIRGSGTRRQARTDLTFFDIAGEECFNVSRSASLLSYIFDAKGIILLVDPGGLPSRDQPLNSRNDISPLATRAMVDSLADAIETVTGIPARNWPNVISVVITKFDSVPLASEIWPPEFWLDGSQLPDGRSDASRALKAYSTRSRDALVELGGGGIAAAAETRFGEDKVYFAAASATNQEAVDGKWLNPMPVGCSIPLAQIMTFGNLDWA